MSAELLRTAIDNGDVLQMAVCLEGLDDLNSRYEELEWQWPLMYAILSDSEDCVSLILNTYSLVDVNLKDTYGTTALHTACEKQNKNIVSWLLAKDVIVDAQNKALQTPLYHACIRGNLAIAEMLLNRGADKDIVCGRRKITPYHASSPSIRAMMERRESFNPT